MSMNYGFWKYKNGIYLDNQKTFEALSNGDYVDGLEELPINVILDNIERAFDGYNQDEFDKSSWESETKGSFKIYTTPQFFRVDVYGQMPQENINELIDIMSFESDCPSYDPQINWRFGGVTIGNGNVSNTHAPCLLVIQKKGYNVEMWYWKTGDDDYSQEWKATKDGNSFLALNTLELLGLIAMWEVRGDDWRNYTDDEKGVYFNLTNNSPVYSTDDEGNIILLEDE